MENQYRRVATAKLGGTEREASILISPLALAATFGPPTDEPWDIESIGSYYFVSSEQKVFTVYFRTPDQTSEEIKTFRQVFWSSSNPIEFGIGARGIAGVAEFCKWLSCQVEK